MALATLDWRLCRTRIFIFINFNYTDTLLKRFGVKETDEYHIHGEAKNKKSIIFGHASHPQLPEKMLYRLGGRFRGLYFVDEILYKTDKHIEDNIQELCIFFAMHGVMAEEIKHVYVLGHSMSIPDIQYFIFWANATKREQLDDENVAIKDEAEFGGNETKGKYNEMEELHQRMQYVINRVGYGQVGKNDEKQQAAIMRRFQKEQEARNEEYHKLFMGIFKKEQEQTENQSIVIERPRIEDAMWHISYYSKEDKKRAETLMEELGCKNVVLCPTIDECLQKFRRNMS